MEIWLDTIDEVAIVDAARLGVIAGVTTNPTILSAAVDVKETLSKILDLQPGPIAVQVTSQEAQAMIEEGRCIFAFSARTIVKVPIEREGLIAIKQLQADKIPVLGTSIVSASQALLAFHHKVSYMAPYFSHAPDPQGLLKAMVDMVNASRSSTKIMSAALKEIDHVLYAAALGAAAVTIKADLYYQLMGTHPIAEGFLQKFMQDWQERQGGVSLCKML